MAAAAHRPHFDAAPEAVRLRLEAVAERIAEAVPGAQACERYRMPAFRSGKAVIHFAAFKHHIGMYPPVAEPAGLVERLARWRGPKGNLAFPHGEPLPLELIGEAAAAIARHYQSQGEK